MIYIYWNIVVIETDIESVYISMNIFRYVFMEQFVVFFVFVL